MFDPVTIRYAEALFGLAKSRGALAEVQADVERIAREFENPEVATFFFDARISVESRRQKLRPLYAGMNELTRNFVDLLFDKRREEVLAGLGAAFSRRLLDERGAAEGVVESARPLAADDLARIETALGRSIQKTVKLENRVDPALIGGLRVIVESRMMDFSLRGRLEGLRKHLLDAPLPSLQEI